MVLLLCKLLNISLECVEHPEGLFMAVDIVVPDDTIVSEEPSLDAIEVKHFFFPITGRRIMILGNVCFHH